MSERIDVSRGPHKKNLIERKLADFGPLTTNDLKFTRNTKPQVAAQVELVFTSMNNDLPVPPPFGSPYPFWLRICAEKELGRYSTIPPNLISQIDALVEPNTAMKSMGEEFLRKYVDANAEAYRLWEIAHKEVMSDCNLSYHKTDSGEGADDRGCPNDLITALFIIISMRSVETFQLLRHTFRVE